MLQWLDANGNRNDKLVTMKLGRTDDGRLTLKVVEKISMSDHHSIYAKNLRWDRSNSRRFGNGVKLARNDDVQGRVSNLVKKGVAVRRNDPVARES